MRGPAKSSSPRGTQDPQVLRGGVRSSLWTSPEAGAFYGTPGRPFLSQRVRPPKPAAVHQGLPKTRRL